MKPDALSFAKLSILVALLVMAMTVPFAAASTPANSDISVTSATPLPYLSAHGVTGLRIVFPYYVSGAFLSWMNKFWANSSMKANVVKFTLNNLNANAIIIQWRRQNVTSGSWIDNEWQAEAPGNSGNLNPMYMAHLDQWVALSKQYGFYIIFDESFSPLLAQSRGQWTGFNDTVFQQHWQTFYSVFAKHFAGNTTIAGFLCCEDVVLNNSYPYTASGSASFNSLWRAKMTNLSLAVHQADPNFNFISEVALDWRGGQYTLGSKAIYPNAWQPLTDPSPHVLYRAQWNLYHTITNPSKNPYYPYDNGLANGGANWIKETGLPFITAVEVGQNGTYGDWVWDTAAFKWEVDLLNKLKADGIGLNFCNYANQTTLIQNPNALFDLYGNEMEWGIVYGTGTVPPTTTTITSQGLLFVLLSSCLVIFFARGYPGRRAWKRSIASNRILNTRASHKSQNKSKGTSDQFNTAWPSTTKDL